MTGGAGARVGGLQQLVHVRVDVGCLVEHPPDLPRDHRERGRPFPGVDGPAHRVGDGAVVADGETCRGGHGLDDDELGPNADDGVDGLAQSGAQRGGVVVQPAQLLRDPVVRGAGQVGGRALPLGFGRSRRRQGGVEPLQPIPGRAERAEGALHPEGVPSAHVGRRHHRRASTAAPTAASAVR